MNLLFSLSLGAAIFSLLAILISLGLPAPSRAGHRLAETTGAGGGAPLRRQRRKRLENRAIAAMRLLRGQLRISPSAKLRQHLIAAGQTAPETVEVYFAARMLCPVAGILAASFFLSHLLLWIMALAGAGFMLPEFWLDRAIQRRREKIRKSIPDAIDLLVICVDAGLGLDQAMLRAGQELALSHPELNEEFLQINREQRAGKPRIEAWRSMAERTRLAEAEGFVSMLVQTERFGAPIVRALSIFADGLRLKRRQLAEEQAAKSTVKMIFPLVIFIFPCMFIVLLGPAMLSISRGFAAMMH